MNTLTGAWVPRWTMSMSTSTGPDLTMGPLYRPVVTYSRQGNMLICRLCPGAVAWGEIHRHLFKAHGLLQPDRELALADFTPDPARVDLAMTMQQIYRAALPNSSMVEPLLPVVDGFRCQFCAYLTQSRELVRKHLRNQHHDRKDVFRPDDIISRHYLHVRL